MLPPGRMSLSPTTSFSKSSARTCRRRLKRAAAVCTKSSPPSGATTRKRQRRVQMAAAISEAAERAANAHQTEEHAREGRAAGFGGVSGNPQFSKTESAGVAHDDRDQRHETALRQWTEQR